MKIPLLIKKFSLQALDSECSDWRILSMVKSLTENEGHSFVLHIYKEADDILYIRFGKLAWGVGSLEGILATLFVPW